MKKVFIWVLGITLGIYLLSVITNTDYVWKTIRYNYVDYDDYKIFDNRTIEKGKIQPWPKAQQQFEIPEELDKYLGKMETIGVLAIKDGKVIAEKYWPEYDEETIANSFSVAKSYVSMLVGFALQDGYFDSIDDPITKYLPELDAEPFAKITLRHCLTMSSGLEWIERYNMPINHTSESYYGKDLWKLVSGLESINEPGEVFHYKGSDPQLLAFAIEAATGRTLSQYLSEKFWKPTGSTSDGLWSLDDANGHEKAYCCINTTARNFARIGHLYLNHGKWNGRRLLDSSWVAKSTTPHYIPNRAGEKCDYYGYQWWLMDDLEKDIFYCRGLNGQYVLCFPKKDLVIVRIGNLRESDGNHPVDARKLAEWGETL